MLLDLARAMSFAPGRVYAWNDFASKDHLSVATGFAVRSHDGIPFLITNRHVVTGRHQATGKCLASSGVVPTRLTVEFASLLGGVPFRRVIPLGDAEELHNYPLETVAVNWIEHPVLGPKVDVVALPLGTIAPTEFLVFINLPPWPPSSALWPTTRLSVVGFPFGQVGPGDLAIWNTATVASQPELDYAGLPSFLVDSRTRKGQSGSPVMHYRTPEDPHVSRNGSLSWGTGHRLELVGVYSGRIRKKSDIGVVWKASVIADIVNSATSSVGSG